MTSGSLKRAASQNGVAPTSSGAKLKSFDERRVGVQVLSGAFGVGAVGEQRAHHAASRRMMAAWSAVNPAAAAFGSAPRSSRNSTSSPKPECAASTVGADAPRIRVVHVRAGRHQQRRRRQVADARRKQQRRIAAVRNHLVVVRARRAAARPSSGSTPPSGACTSAPCASSTLTTSGCFCATAHISAVWPRAAARVHVGALRRAAARRRRHCPIARRPSAASRRAAAPGSDSRRPAAAA